MKDTKGITGTVEKVDYSWAGKPGTKPEAYIHIWLDDAEEAFNLPCGTEVAIAITAVPCDDDDDEDDEDG